jgi:hypothetical protein
MFQNLRSFFKRPPPAYTGNLLPAIADLREVKGLDVSAEKWISYTSAILKDYKTISASKVISRKLQHFTQ